MSARQRYAGAYPESTLDAREHALWAFGIRFPPSRTCPNRTHSYCGYSWTALRKCCSALASFFPLKSPHALLYSPLAFPGTCSVAALTVARCGPATAHSKHDSSVRAVLAGCIGMTASGSA
jgi:hypothetical protein